MRNIFLLIICIFVSNSLLADCIGPLYSYYICNYTGQTKITDLNIRSKKWFFFDINNGWYKVEFSNLNQLKIDGTASVTKPMNRFEFEYYKEFEPGLQSYKLNVICNDTRFENGPVIYYQIESTDSDFCKKFPENSLIEVGR